MPMASVSNDATDPSALGSPPRYQGSGSDVTEVVIVSKTHMDVGFTDLARNVRDRYLRVFFPSAIATAQELAGSGEHRFIWTVGSWILNEALEDPEVGTIVEQAVVDGVLRWHALPFTVHTEFCDRSVLAAGLRISSRLDERFGMVTRSAKMTDVPGHTRGLVSLLSDFGVEFLHIGLNPVATAPKVPLQFRWRDLATHPGGGIGCCAPPSVMVMYQPGSYGDVQIIANGARDGSNLAVATLLTGDNLGPPTAAMVRDTWTELHTRFPLASIRAGTLEDVVSPATNQPDLPFFEGEIGDTWIHGVGSDPQKTAAYRDLCRLRRRWISEGTVDETDPVLERATSHLLMVGEHTWGMDQKTWWPNLTVWTPDELAEERRRSKGEATDSSGNIQLFESSWDEQRQYLRSYVDTLNGGGGSWESLAEQAALSLSTHSLSSLSDLQPKVVAHLEDPNQTFTLEHDDWRITINPESGLISELVSPTGLELVDAAHPIASVATQLFDADHFERWYNSYNRERLPEDERWARWDNTKPGLENTQATSAWVYPKFRDSVFTDDAHGNGQPRLRLTYDYSHLDSEQHAHGTFASHIDLDIVLKDDGIEFELTMHDRVCSRFPQADWWSFHPRLHDDVTKSGGGWSMLKLDEWVRPQSVVSSGGRFLHVADILRHDCGLQFDLLDSPLVAVGKSRLLTWDVWDTSEENSAAETLGENGWNVCLYNNMWGTNFPMWNGGMLRSRVRLSLKNS